MPEIGSTLREARMRAKIDITEVEQATKIRAKYLRALENEEWSLVPGSTFVKSFLREYADYLGLDARLLVEEYKARYEDPTEHELAPITPGLGRERRRGLGSPGGGPIAPGWAIVGGVIVLLLVALGVVGSIGGSGGGSSNNASTARPPRATSTTPPPRTTPAPAPARASVAIVPTATVYVCLVDEHGKVLIPGTTFSAGQQVPVYRARAMRLTLGNNGVQLRVNGRPLAVPASATAIAYRLTPDGASPLPASQAPTCT